MAPTGAIMGPIALRFLRVALANTTKVVRAKLANAARPLQGELQAIPIRTGYTGRQPIHPAALLRQQRRGTRWFSSGTAQRFHHAVRRFLSSESGAQRFDRSRVPSSNTLRNISRSSGRPFATTLRPNLTGGAMPRTAGGYSSGGGARYFSHTPAAPAQVVQQVSQAMRGFLISGQKIRYDGLNARGERKYRAVSGIEDQTMSKFRAFPVSAPGAFVDFQLNPQVTALSPLAAALSAHESGFGEVAATLNTDGLLDVLSEDFNRALKDLSAISADLQRLSQLGDLPIVLHAKNTIRVRFPGVDADTVERLCDDIGIQRGFVGEDIDFDVAAGVPVALKFPFAPDSEKTITSPGGSARSQDSQDLFDEFDLDDVSVRDAFVMELAENPWHSDPEAFESLSPPSTSAEHISNESFEGLEGIYRFLEECDKAKGRLG